MTILGLATPWQWVQPRGHDELVKRLLEAADFRVHERERENLCSCAAAAICELREDTGRSLRGWFAGLAMQGLLANPHRDYDPKDLAELAYAQADAMIAELKKERAK